MLYDPSSRLKAVEVLAHTYFDEVRTRSFFDFFTPDIKPKTLFSFDECKNKVI